MNVSNNHRLGYFCACLLAAGLGLSTPAQAGGGTIDPSVRTLFDEGMKAAQAGRWEDARRNFSEGWSTSKSPQVLAQLCRAELNTGHNAEAVGHLQELLRVVPDLTAEDKARIEGMLAQAKSKAGSVRVEAPEGAEIFVDDVKVGKAPLADDLVLDTGRRVFEARVDGKPIAKMDRTLAPGSVVTVRLRPLLAETHKVKVKPEEDKSLSTRTVVLISGLSVTAGTAGAGALLAAMSYAQHDGNDAAIAANCVPSSQGCRKPTPTERQGYNDRENQRAALSNASFGTFLAAGIIGAGTAVVTLAWPSPASPKKEGLSPKVMLNGGIGQVGTTFRLDF